MCQGCVCRYVSVSTRNLASEPEGNLVTTEGPRAGQPTVFATELDILDQGARPRRHLGAGAGGGALSWEQDGKIQ